MQTDRQIKWDCTKDELQLMAKIAARATRELAHQEHHSTLMDINATHSNGCPLDLVKLLAADRFNFSHDILGIYRHINRTTGELEDCFVPRCAK